MDERAPYPHVAAAIDGSESDDSVVATARLFASFGVGGRLTLLHVVAIPPPIGGDPSYSGWLGVGATLDPTPFLDAGRALLDRMADVDRGEETVLLEGFGPEAISDFAEEGGVDLLVLGAPHGRERLSFGGVSSDIAHHAPCSVVLVRGGEPS